MKKLTVEKSIKVLTTGLVKCSVETPFNAFSRTRTSWTIFAININRQLLYCYLDDSHLKKLENFEDQQLYIGNDSKICSKQWLFCIILNYGYLSNNTILQFKKYVILKIILCLYDELCLFSILETIKD